MCDTPISKPALPPWKVVFGRGFFPRKTREHSGAELQINQTFFWDATEWTIPSVYLCAKGLVIDCFVSTDAERFCAFWDKWTDDDGRERSYTVEEQLQIALENPLRHAFDASVLCNGKLLRESCAYGESYLPPACRRDGMHGQRTGEAILAHYGLDENRCWSFRRISFPWVTKRKPRLPSLTLTLQQDPLSFPGPTFSVSAPGDTVSFSHPRSGKDHVLTVTEYEAQEMDPVHFGDGDTDYPTHYTVMTFTVTPPLPRHAIFVADSVPGDRPRKRQPDPYGPQAQNDVALSVIGGADGPTALFVASGSSHAAVSSLHFLPQEQVVWRTTFRERTAEDVTLTLGQFTRNYTQTTKRGLLTTNKG